MEDHKKSYRQNRSDCPDSREEHSGKGHSRPKKESAFRAYSTKLQEVEANKETKVYYDQEEFDLGHEYEPCPSLFIPRRDGVYLVTAHIGFTPESYKENYRARIALVINGEPFENVDNDFWGKGVPIENGVQVNAIVKLKADDEVEVFMQSTVAGTIQPSMPGERFNVFSAAKLADLG